MAATAVPALAIAFWRNALASGLLLPAALLTCRDELRALDRRELGAILLGVQAHRAGLDAHGQVLAHHRDAPALVGEVLGDGENAGVVVPQPETVR